MDILILNIAIIAIGLILGSFINVLAYRIPKNMPIMLARSLCPKCKSLIPLYRNIPIITYIFQRGKCHNCSERISLQYPMIELLTACILYIGFQNNWPIDEYILFIWVSSLLLVIAIIDLKTLTIPFNLIVVLFSGELLFLFYNLNLASYMLWGLIFGLGYLGITFIGTSIIYKKQTLGYGDLLLISLLGLWLGPINILICIFLSSIMGITLWVIKQYKKNNNEKLPFGTYLSINGILLKILNIDFISYMNNL